MAKNIKFAKYRNNPEFTQSILRFAIWLTISLLIWIQFSGEIEKLEIQRYLFFMFLFLIITVTIFVSILILPRSTIRPYLTPIVDISGISYTMILTSAGPFSAYYLLFPWVFVGYGARYGRGPIFIAAIISIIEYIYILYFFNSWATELFSATLFTLFLIILPLYIYNMTSKLKRSQQSAIEANNIKSEFLTAMSHEIRTPMSGVIGMISLLKDTKLDTTQSEYVAALQESSTALQVLINDILDLSKIEAGKQQLQNSHFNLTQVVQGVVQIFTPTAHAKGIELISYVQPEIPKIVNGDPNKLRQIILNLISNAVKFTEQGEVTVKATIVPNKKDELVRIRIDVTDTGLGIPNHQLEKIFEPFYQGKNISSDKHSGTGLGTTISHQLATLMNGEIGACSDLNKGSIFWIELPYHYCEYQNEKLTLPHPDATNIIVLDEIKSSAVATENYLTSLQIIPKMALNEQFVIDYLDENISDKTPPVMVILSESTLFPDRSSVVKRIKQRYSSKIYILLITHIQKLNKINTNSNSLYDSYLIQPFNVFVLQHTISSIYSGIKQNSAHNLNPDSNLGSNKKALNNSNIIYSILVAEDSDINAKVICTFLEQEGHKATRVISGFEALEQLKTQHYDIVFMDMHMPDMGGVEATQQWRQQDLDSTLKSEINLPIVALTANATTDDQKLCLSSGMNRFLPKPVSKDELLAVVNQLVTLQS